MLDDLTIAQTPSADWEGLEREARHAAVLVAMVVGVPAAVAAGAALLIFAFQWLVLLAPLVAAALTWIVWRYGKPERRPERPGA
jgi:membrane protein implicated in regulation of membrane protease activity